MIEIENLLIFGEVTAKAVKAIDGSGVPTWEKVRLVNAVAKAAARLTEHGEFLTWFDETQSLLIWSDSNEIYTVAPGQPCTCQSAAHNNVCWHRVARQLMQRYCEALVVRACPTPEPQETAMPYLKANASAPAEVVGGIRI